MSIRNKINLLEVSTEHVKHSDFGGMGCILYVIKYAIFKIKKYTKIVQISWTNFIYNLIIICFIYNFLLYKMKKSIEKNVQVNFLKFTFNSLY